jgi:hypothetical protein
MPRSVLPRGSGRLFDTPKLWGVAARAVLATPLSGPLARFGKAGANALALWAERSGISLEVIDAYPFAAPAIRAAEASRPDVVFGPYGSGRPRPPAKGSSGTTVAPPPGWRGRRIRVSSTWSLPLTAISPRCSRPWPPTVLGRGQKW